MSTEYNTALVIGFIVPDSIFVELQKKQAKKMDIEDLLTDFCKKISDPKAGCKPKISGNDRSISWLISIQGEKPESENYGNIQYYPIDKVVSRYREAQIIAKNAQKIGIDLGEPVIASVLMAF